MVDCTRRFADVRYVLFVRADLSAAKPRGGSPQRPDPAVSASLRLPCDARSRGPPPNSLRSLRSLRSDRGGESDVEARCARGHEPCASRRLQRALRTAPTRLRVTVRACAAFLRHPNVLRAAPLSAPGAVWTCAAPVRHSRWTSRRAAPAAGDLWSAEQRSFGVGANEESASSSDSLPLFERSERSERSEFGSATPKRAAQGSRSAAETAQP